MKKNITEAINIIEDVRKTMPECTNKAFLKGALNELNEALAKQVKLTQQLKQELEKSRAKCSTNNKWDYPYSYGVEFAVELVEKTK